MTYKIYKVVSSKCYCYLYRDTNENINKKYENRFKDNDTSDDNTVVMLNRASFEL